MSAKKSFHFTKTLYLYEEQQINLNLWSVDILSILAGQASQPDMPVGCLLGFENYCAYLKMNVKLDRKPCNRFRIGTERLNRGALVTTLARQFERVVI